MTAPLQNRRSNPAKRADDPLAGVSRDGGVAETPKPDDNPEPPPPETPK